MKRGRRIVVGGLEYVYRLDGRSQYGGETAPVLTLLVLRDRKLFVRATYGSTLYQGTPDEGHWHLNSFTPSMVRQVIETATDPTGWPPGFVGDWKLYSADVQR